MKCPACNGEVTQLTYNFNGPKLDTLGVCRDCCGVKLSNDHKVLASRWCHCPDTHAQEIYFWSDIDHGWLHTECGQITQTG